MSSLISLESVRVASPCRADWNKMEGDDRARFCQTCAKNVYNLSDMSHADAEALLQEKEGNLCVRFYQRADGTIITDNCPVGVKMMRRPLKWLVAGFAFFIASGTALFGSAAKGSTPSTADKAVAPHGKLYQAPLVKTVMSWIDPISQSIDPPIAGGIMAPQPTPAPSPEPEE